MKAVILAGGEGARLRPLSLGLPKPMTPLFDKPVMEHIIALLRRSGITQIGVTLRYMPQSIQSHFGDGSQLGVSLTYFVEPTPMGTAGGVKRCMSWLGEEDFLVISGDAVCDLDLKAAMAFHAVRRSAATLLLCRHPSPLAYGLVLTDEEGRVERFVEKPAWGQVLTNQVNTGIYLLSRRAMDRVPAGKPWDFAKDLFPALLASGEQLYGHLAEGYWRDMGDCPAYLASVTDALAGRVSLELDAPKQGPGIWSASPLPPSVQIIPPCYIGANVRVGEGSLLGPNTVLESGSTVGRFSLVQESVVQGAHIGDRATLYGAILCRNAFAARGAVLNEGSVLGAGACVETDAVVMEQVRVWPRRVVPAGTRLTATLAAGGLRGLPCFGEGGVIRGRVGQDLTPNLLLLLGNRLGEAGPLGLGWSGGDGAAMLARAAGSGCAAAGSQVTLCDAPTPAAAAWLGACSGLESTLFVQQEGEALFLHFFDRRGLPLPRDRQRRLESALLQGELIQVPAGRVGRQELVSGTLSAYGADAARRSRLSHHPMAPLRVAVPQRDGADAPLALALGRLGCAVQGRWERGIPSFETAHGGFYLLARDEDGMVLEPERLLAMVALVEWENGEGRVAVPAGAPALLNSLAERTGGTLLRLGQDGPQAETCYEGLPWLRDGVFAACRLCARLGLTGERLSDLAAQVPPFRLRRREVPLSAGRGALVQALLTADKELVPAGEGLRRASGEGWIYLLPLARRSALRIVGEGPDMETAAELCDFYAGKVRNLDKEARASQNRTKEGGK